MKNFILAITSNLLLILSILGIWTAFDIVKYADTPSGFETKDTLVMVMPGQKLKTTSNILYQNRIIRKPLYFYIYARVTGYGMHIKAGEYLLSASMTPVQILNVLASGRVYLHKITIPEGYNLKEIADVFAESGLMEKSLFLKAAKNFKLDPSLKTEADSLEGYLFPDTYYFPKGISAEKIIATMINQFKQVVTPEMIQQAHKEGLSLHQAVTLASIIEKETGSENERSIISSVFHNRLKRGMRLESDPTVIYGIENFDGNITRKHLSTPTPYNTYTRHGLPPGPIASPGAKSLMAAVYPAQTDYLFFVSRKDKTHKFSRTFGEHSDAVRKYQLGGKD